MTTDRKSHKCTRCGEELLPIESEGVFIGWDWMGHKCKKRNSGYTFIPASTVLEKPIVVPEEFRGLLPKLADNQEWHVLSQTKGNTQSKLRNVSLQDLGSCSYQLQSNGYHHIISRSGHTIVCTIVFKKSPPPLYWQDKHGNSLEE